MESAPKAPKAPKITNETISAMNDDTLGNWLIEMARAYYNHDTQPLVSDELFDFAKDLLESRNPDHPALQQIGHATAVDLKFDRNKVTLPCPMWSLDKIKADPAILAKFVKSYPDNGYVVSDKLDGISALYVFKKGKAYLYTRGNGTVGHDISQFLLHLRGVPVNKPKDAATLMARCELIISKAGWETIKHLGSNARNVVAGVLNAKTPNLEIARIIEMVAYELIMPDKVAQLDQLARLQTWGFTTAQYVHISAAEMTVPGLSAILVQRKAMSPYVVDGIVVAHNGVHVRNATGNPDHAFAFKSLITQDRATVTIGEVEWNISKDRFAKPLAKFPKVSLNGVEIKQATLFNAAYVETHVIGPGSRVVIIRAGDVIPHIIEVLSPATSGKPSMPEDFDWSWNSTHVDIIATGNAAMETILVKELTHFFDKVDVAGVSDGVITKLVNSGARSVRDIMTLQVSDLLRIEGFKEKMAVKVVGAIRDAMAQLTPLTLMVASNAFGRGFGDRRLQLIIDNVPGLLGSGRVVPIIGNLVAIPGLQVKTSSAFLEALPKFWEFVDANELGYVFTAALSTAPTTAAAAAAAAAHSVQSNKMNGQVILFTGFRDADLEGKIVAASGRMATALNSKTTILVIDVNGKKSGKADKAEQMGVRVLSREEMEELLA